MGGVDAMMLSHGHVWTPLSVQEKSPNRLVAGGRVLPCVRPLVRLAHGRGPVWDSGIRSTPLERALDALPVRLVLLTPPHRHCVIPVL
jgi:hypothetical protein